MLNWYIASSYCACAAGVIFSRNVSDARGGGNLVIKLISTDFDGTLFSEFEAPPVPEELQALIGRLQGEGAKWVINTGRDMPGLMESLARAQLAVQPDYLVLVEREIHFLDGDRYVSLAEWNDGC